ncbi:FmdB family zinc ribbon protein [Nocardioides daeguensis]|uniref:Putative regulatory protein FmdB zinc ribbon domain-containing protein n=1 Tax=Nocardioides daeguensis TaxID=908359 RepID=A0ABP6V2X7_9ACTN|nr:FmdB family zinc ribbon protein [Nocardioides daeguensis]MBV6727165.1 FmdB family transcriptional regulator [Nocardioides daeguensis]MCR1771179.1 FmdB family transcriptional regulator [Nocardioides daeguensis]
MPTYQYLCTECGHAFEQVQKFSDDALTTCPECTGKLRKVFNSVGVVFKGSGFYKTDSKSSTSASSTPATSTSSSSSSSSSGSSGSDAASSSSASSSGSSSSSSAASPA